MPLRPEKARAALPGIDPARLRSGWPVGLRDGALLALIAAGFSATEICDLKASAITMKRDHILITVRRHGVLWKAVLPSDLGSRVLAWLTESRLWAVPTPIFDGSQGGLTPPAVYQMLRRYLRPGKGSEMSQDGPAAGINPQELLTWWEGRGGRRPLSLRALARKLRISETRARKHLQALRAAGQIDDQARTQALAARGGHRKGGRPARAIDNADLLAAWHQKPNIAAVARRLQVSRSRIRARLQEIGFAGKKPAAPPSPAP